MKDRILPLLAFIGAIALFVLYINPTWTGTIADARVAIANDDSALAAASAYTAEEGQLVSQRDAISPADLKRLDTFLPDSVDNVGLILNLNALAARSGLSLSHVDVSSSANGSGGSSGALPAAGANPVGSVDISVSAIGTYPALVNFLRGVEMSERLLDVQEITVKGSETGVYNYQMRLRLYWLR